MVEGQPGCIEGKEEESSQLKWNWQEENDPRGVKEREESKRHRNGWIQRSTEGKNPSE